jgi:hypothetical protein
MSGKIARPFLPKERPTASVRTDPTAKGNATTAALHRLAGAWKEMIYVRDASATCLLRASDQMIVGGWR